MLGVVALLPLCSGLVVVQPTLPTLQQAFTSPREARTATADSFSTAIFPSDVRNGDGGIRSPAASSAKPTIAAGMPSSALLAKNCNEEACTDEEVAQAKSEAQRTFLIIVLLGALPSFYAQDELVWKKERQGRGGKQTKK